MTQEEKYMIRCIQLAKNGAVNVSPNPMVGAVIVCDGKIIGEGYHVCCGHAHAEVNAINSVKDKTLLQRSTIYVSLEPCSHFGKTPPCADLIIAMRIPRVVIGCPDPFPMVAGCGIKRLSRAGVKVRVGVMENECRNLIRKFITFNMLRRPYITLKWAESADRYIDLNRESGRPVVLSNPLSTMLVHKRRAESDAIMIGTRTAFLDNPSLTVRDWYGKSPVRILLDQSLSLPVHLHLFDGMRPTIVFTGRNPCSTKKIEYVQIDFSKDVLPQILDCLYHKNIQSLLVEGGRFLLQSFINNGLWDEVFIERTDKLLGNGVPAPVVSSFTTCSEELIFDSGILHFIK